MFSYIKDHFVATRSQALNTMKVDPWLYSIGCFLPIINLQQKENWVPSLKRTHGQPMERMLVLAAKIYRPVETLTGWILAALLIAGVSGLIRRD